MFSELELNKKALKNNVLCFVSEKQLNKVFLFSEFGLNKKILIFNSLLLIFIF